MINGLREGNRLVLAEPNRGLSYLMDANPSLDRRLQAAQLDALINDAALTSTVTARPQRLRAWVDWSVEGGLFREDQRSAIDAMIQPAGSRCPQSP